MATKHEVLQDVTFGDAVAEQEADNLQRYFVSTDQWRRVLSGTTDVVYGPKGSGKSAIYSLLQRQAAEMAQRNITFITAENPRGTPAFRELATDPPATEVEFVRLWKLYFLSLIGTLLEEPTGNADAAFVVSQLQESGLLQKTSNLKDRLSAVWRYVRSFFVWESAEGGLKLDPVSGLPSGITGKITFGSPQPELSKAGMTSVDTLLTKADSALTTLNRKIWIGIDRLDVAFEDNEDLEANALRALFRVYRDFQSYPSIDLLSPALEMTPYSQKPAEKLAVFQMAVAFPTLDSVKVFLRTDIWNRISETGFREASHITKTLTITWNKDLLLNLVMRRALQSSVLCSFYGIEPEKILDDLVAQRQLFGRMMPPQAEY